MNTVYGPTVGAPGPEGWNGAKMSVLGLSLKYPPRNGRKKKDDEVTVRNVSLPLFVNKVTAIMGPSGCGKSSLIKIFNNIHQLYPSIKIEGRVLLDGENVLSPDQDVQLLRARVGMVFQKATPFPMSIYENIAFAVRLYESLSKADMDARVEMELRRAALWDEVKDRLRDSAIDLSGGQQQRLCIARSVAIKPEVLLMDEPCSALDRHATVKIEELIEQLKTDYTISIVTHNEHQAARVADYIGCMDDGQLVEFDTAKVMTLNPSTEFAQDFIRGRVG